MKVVLTGLAWECAGLQNILSAINRGIKMVTFPDGRVAYNRESAIDILGDYGLNEDDVTEFAELVLESELKTLYNQVQDARKGDNWELIADDYYNAIVSAVNLIDEQLEKPRLRNVRQLLVEVKNQLENY